MQDSSDISVVGHRVVHGADSFNSAVVVTQTVENAIEEASRLAPLHNPANLLGIREAKQLFNCPHVAVFDTAFHSTIPRENYTYAIPLDLAAKHKIRRYGFHGTSYCYVSRTTIFYLNFPLSFSAPPSTISCLFSLSLHLSLPLPLYVLLLLLPIAAAIAADPVHIALISKNLLGSRGGFGGSMHGRFEVDDEMSRIPRC